MLTIGDLKSIGKLIDDKLDAKLAGTEKRLEEKLETKLTGMEKRLEEKLETKLEEKLETKLNAKLNPIKRDIAKINSSITKIQKDQTTIVNYFDQEYTGLNTRMRRVENYLHLPVIQ